MLTHEEKIRLNSQIFIAPHLRYFCNKYSNDPECPAHFEDMMKRFCWMKRDEQVKFYIIDDELYIPSKELITISNYNPLPAIPATLNVGK